MVSGKSRNQPEGHRCRYANADARRTVSPLSRFNFCVEVLREPVRAIRAGRVRLGRSGIRTPHMVPIGNLKLEIGLRFQNGGLASGLHPAAGTGFAQIRTYLVEVWTDALPQRNCGRFQRPSLKLPGISKEPLPAHVGTKRIQEMRPPNWPASPFNAQILSILRRLVLSSAFRLLLSQSGAGSMIVVV